jgi:hypothetical protein
MLDSKDIYNPSTEELEGHICKRLDNNDNYCFGNVLYYSL